MIHLPVGALGRVGACIQRYAPNVRLPYASYLDAMRQLSNVFALAALFSQGASAEEVLTQRYDNGRIGSTSNPGLNQAAIRDPRWGLLGRLQVHGTVYAQPLYVQQLPLPGTTQLHDVVLLATAQNSVSAFDAQTLAQLWQATPPLGPNDRTMTRSPFGCDFLSAPEGIGIEATPVIDRAHAVMFVSYRTNPSAIDLAAAEQRLRAMDIRSGARLLDVKVAPPGSEPDWAARHRSRAGLLLLDGVIYVAFGSRCEDPNQPIFHGWILAYDAATLNRVGAFQTTPDVAPGKTIDGGGIWQGAVGLAADPEGFIYAITGNRRLGADKAPRDASNVADSFLRLKPTATRAPDGSVKKVDLALADWFTPYRKIWLDATDLDLGAAGPVVIPNSRFLVGGGKSGILYVLDRANMGRVDTTHAWDATKLAQLAEDAIAAEWPEDWSADRVVQKFQAAFHQYIPEGSPYLPHAGGHMATAMQNASQQDAFAVGRDGALWVWWEAGNGPWTDGTSGRRGPAAITPPKLAPPDAKLVAAKQTENQLDAFVVGNDGAVSVSWVAGIGSWAGPAHITPAGFAPPSSALAVANQTSSQLDTFVAGSDGAVSVSWVVGTGNWAGPAHITPPGFAPPGAGVAAAQQTENQLDAFTIGSDGAVSVSWVVGTSSWAGPARVTPPGFAPSGAGVAAAPQTANQLDVFVVGNDGAVSVSWVGGIGAWAGPVRISPTEFAPPGSCLTAVRQNDQQLDVFVVGNDGAVSVSWVAGVGAWAGPSRITPTGFARPGVCVGAGKPNPAQLNAFVVANDGSVNVTWEVNDGPWTSGPPGSPGGGANLTQALWMNKWWYWPHIHGSPVYAGFGDGRAMLYVWPEKDHLKAFPWLGNRVDLDHKILGTGLDHALVLAPPGPPLGMPGGMLAVTIDPTRPDSGVLFASVARVPDQSRGSLRAFDPLSLEELWNNQGHDYAFVKFVPPTIAGGKVFLPTGANGPNPTNAVLVYGLR